MRHLRPRPDTTGERVRRIVQDWPPLTDEQRNRLAMLLRPIASTESPRSEDELPEAA